MTKQLNKSDTRDLVSFDKETIELIKNTVAKGATDQELQLFLYHAKERRLNPLAKQIYFMKRDTKAGPVVTIQTSIDGFRVIAERSNTYSGQDKPEYEEDGTGHPIKCTVTVYKIDPRGNRVGISSTAYWNEYCPAAGQDFMWKKLPHTMLAKVAESLALRKAFPQDLSGLYTKEEMDQEAEAVIPVVDQNIAPKKESINYNDDIRRMAVNALTQIENEVKNEEGYDYKTIGERLVNAEKKLQNYPDLMKRASDLHQKVINDMKYVQAEVIEANELPDVQPIDVKVGKVFDVKKQLNH